MREPQEPRPPSLWSLDRRGLTAAVALGSLYAALFSVLSVLRHASFHSHAFDLALHHQATWNASRGFGLDYTLFLAWHPDLTCILGDHVNLILFLPAILFWIHAGPETLLILQALVVGSAAIPLFGLSRRLLGSTGVGVAFAAVFLLHPGIHAANFFDFHAVLLAAAFLVWAFYLAEVRSRAGFWLALVLALSCQENVAIVVALMGVWLLVKGRRRTGVLVLLAGAAWFAVCFFWILPAFNPGTGSNHFSRYQHLGQTWSDVLRKRLPAPDDVPSPAGRSAGPLLRHRCPCTDRVSRAPAPEILLVAGSELAFSVLSSFWPQRTIDYQYAAIVVAVATVAAIHGAARLKRSVAARGGPARFVGPVAAATAVCLSIAYQARSYGNLRPLSAAFREQIRLTPHSRLGDRFLAQIPEDAPVSAQSDIVPHLSGRRRIYLFPDVRDADFVLLDTSSELFPMHQFLRPGRSPEQSYNEYLQRLVAPGGFRVQDVADGWLLLRRNGEGAGLASPAERTYHRGDIRVEEWPASLARGSTAEVEVTLGNTSRATWFPQNELPYGYQVNLSYHWLSPSGKMVVFDGVRTALPVRVGPGEKVTVRARVAAPAEPGAYLLEFDLVQEKVTWFGREGSTAPSSPVEVR